MLRSVARTLLGFGAAGGLFVTSLTSASAMALDPAKVPVSITLPGSVSPNGLSGCTASRTNLYSDGRFHGGHSYCSSGGTAGEQRVVVYCTSNENGSDVVLYYGDWTIAKQWSEVLCPSGRYADQAQYETA